MSVSADGKSRIVTEHTVFEVNRKQPTNPQQRETEQEKGPLYQIVFSLQTYQLALDKEQQLHTQHKGKVRVNLVPSKNEFLAIARGEFEIVPVVDGE